jgi:hypothetical protein
MIGRNSSHAGPRPWRRLRAATILSLLTLVLAAPARGNDIDSTESDAGSSVAASSARSTRVPPLPGMFRCSSEHLCHFRAGTYELTLGEVIPGLRLTLPPRWSSRENDIGELNLIAPGQPNSQLFIWVDMAAVKSTGPGHGTTVLRNVGRTPRALERWLTSNPDFSMVTDPRSLRLGNIPMRTLSLNVSTTANYGDPGCPDNPRCADFFTRPGVWGDNFFGIGGKAEDRFYIGRIRISGALHTMMVALDGLNHADLLRLERHARPILRSLHLPRCHPDLAGC